MKNRPFDQWNTEKKRVNALASPPFYIKKRQIWFTKMGENIGDEQNGKKEFSRPVLVLKKVGSLFFTVALTTKGKDNHRFYHHIKNLSLAEDHWEHAQQSWVILSQVRVIDKRRFLEKVSTVESKEFEIIKQKITALVL
jgi:mRNA interferase MazF